MPLFRPEALLNKENDALGTITVASPPSHTVWVAGALVAATIIVLWLTLGHYTRRESVEGLLVPHAGLVHLAARESGIVTEVLVTEGQAVAEGQAILRISGDHHSQTLESAGSAVSASLARQEANLDAESKNVRSLSAQQEKTLVQSAALLSQQLSQFERQLTLARQQSDSYTELLERIRPLVRKGYVSQLQIQQQETQALDARSQVETLLRQQVDANRQLTEIKSQLAQLPATSSSKLSELARQRAQIEQSIIENETGRVTVVVATNAGTVSSLIAIPGQSVAAGEPLLAIVPSSSPLEAQLLVPSSAIGFIRIGTPVRLRYVAFPYQKFGIQSGHVSQVSRSALTLNEAAALVGQSAEDKQGRYRVRVALDRETIPAYGHQERLLPGMALEADLMLDRRTLLEWLFEPVLAVRERMHKASL